MFVRKIILGLVLLCLSCRLTAQIGTLIGDSRLPLVSSTPRHTVWQDAGFLAQRPGIPFEFTQYINIQAQGAIGDGNFDNTTIFNTALAQAAAEAAVGGFTIIYVPTGSYRLTAPLYMPSRTVIKGSGASQSSLYFVLSGGNYIYLAHQEMTGFEDIKITRPAEILGDPEARGTYIVFDYSSDSWLRGVETDNAARYHITISQSENIEIRECYIHHAYSYDGGGNGYGILISSGTSACLVENNIFRKLRHAMIHGGDGHFNVWGYNASFEPIHEDYVYLGINWVTSDMCLHGYYGSDLPGAYGNLFEGNLGNFILIDAVWGSNGDYNLFFRNKAAKVGLQIETEHSGVGDSDWNDKQNIVNNYLICDNYLVSTWGYGWWVEGKEQLLKNNYVKELNWLGGWTTSWHDDNHNYYDDISYYHSSRPNFMEGNNWPLDPRTDTNSAYDRYNSGGALAVTAGFSDYAKRMHGQVTLNGGTGNPADTQIRLTKRNSVEIIDLIPMGDGSYEHLFNYAEFGNYDIRFSQTGYNLEFLYNIPIQLDNVFSIPSVVLEPTTLGLQLPASFTFPEDSNLVVDFTPFIYGTDVILSSESSPTILIEIDGYEVSFSAESNWYGTEAVVFTVTNDVKSTALDTTEIVVTPVNDSPVAEADGPYSGQADKNGFASIRLDGSGSYDIDGNIINYAWQWANGNASGPIVFQSFPEGSTQVKLTVKDNANATDQDSAWIYVKPWLGQITGTVQLSDSTGSVTEVTVSANTISSNPDSSGFYRISIGPGLYTVTAGLEGYRDSTVINVPVQSGEITGGIDFFLQRLNRPPVADAGPDQNVNENEMVKLDGSASYDPDGDSLCFHWQPSGLLGADSSAVQPVFQAPEVSSDSILIFNLTVCDGEYNAILDTVKILINNLDQPIVVNTLQPDTSEILVINETETLEFHVSAYDPDGNPLIYRWELNGNPAGSDTLFNFITDYESAGFYNLVLELSDNFSNKNIVQIRWQIIVENRNRPPVAVVGPEQLTIEGANVTLDGSDSYDPDHDPLTFHWEVPARLVLADTQNAQLHFTAPEVLADTAFLFYLKVVDPGGLFSRDSIWLQVQDQDKPIIVESLQPSAGGNISIQETDTILFVITAYDPDGHPLDYLWQKDHLPVSTDSSYIFRTDYQSTGVYQISLDITDNYKKNNRQFSWQVFVGNINRPPVANAGSDQNVNENEFLRLDGSASFDPDRDSLRFHWHIPPGLTIPDSTSIALEFIAPAVRRDSSLIIILTVDDSEYMSAPDTVLIQIYHLNRLPNALPDTYATLEDWTLSVPQLAGLRANDFDPDDFPDTLSTELVDTPRHGTLILKTNGAFMYDPLPNYFGPDSLHYRLYDGSGYSAPGLVLLQINPVNDAPSAQDDFYQTLEDSLYMVNWKSGVLVNDLDIDNISAELVSVLVTDVKYGELDLHSDGSFVYQPDPDFWGFDTFDYFAFDGTDSSETAVVIIEILGINDPPESHIDIYTTYEDSILSILASEGVLSNDQDPDHAPAPLSAILEDSTRNGQITLNPDGAFTYQPDPDFFGTDSFFYRAFDGELYTSRTRISLNVLSVNDSPVAEAGGPYDALADSSGTALICLNGTRSFDRDGTIISWFWEWSEGQAQGDSVWQVFYPGLTQILLTVQDDSGALGTDRSQVTVHAYEGIVSGQVDLVGGSGHVAEVNITAGLIQTHPDSTGLYELGFSPGTYSITASLAGYRDSTISDIQVWQNQITSGIDFLLYFQNPVGVTGEVSIPTVFGLGQNIPNPFNSTTIIPFALPRPTSITIQIFNLRGELLETLFQGTWEAGYHQLTWNAASFSSGIYFYLLETPKQVLVQKMILLR